MNDIFLSYASPDRERVLPLVNILESQGLDVWWDRDIAYGDNYHRVIERALEAAKCAVVIWSTHSVASEWVLNEASEARRRGVLVPALLDDVEPPLEFRHLQAARLVGWAGSPEDDELKNLFRAIQGVVKRDQPDSPGTRVAPPPRQTSTKSWWETPAGWAFGAGILLVGIGVLIGALRFGSTGSTGTSTTPGGQPPSSEPSNNVTPSTGSPNLLDLTAGAKIVGASEAGWKAYIFGERIPACSVIGTGGFVVFAFRDERRARFDRLGIYVESADRYNAKTVEVYASDSTDQGPFMKVATFEIPNYRNERQTFHELKFNEVTARYVKLAIPEFRVGRDAPNGNVCTMELYGSLL